VLLDSAQSTCHIILSRGDAEITAIYTSAESVKNTIKKIPASFGLSCNGKTRTIAFAVPKVTGFSKVPVTIRLFDVRGQLLGVVIDRAMSPGYHAANIGTQMKIAAAMVICRMESPGYRSVAKMLAK